MAEWYDANGNAVVEAVQNNYKCNCGCNLEFIDYEPGFDVYIGNNWLITANAMVNYSWQRYIWMHEFKVWKDFREDIILNYNDTLNNVPMNAEDAPWIHLYNVNVAGKEHIPLNEAIYYQYVY